MQPLTISQKRTSRRFTLLPILSTTTRERPIPIPHIRPLRQDIVLFNETVCIFRQVKVEEDGAY